MEQTGIQYNKAILRYLGAVLILLNSSSINAASWSLSDRPLYLGNSVPPNVLFIIDDSASMDMEVMSSDFFNSGRFTNTQADGSDPGNAGSVTHRTSCTMADGQFYGYSYGVEFADNYFGTGNQDCDIADESAWRFRNNSFNPLYFNPEKEYLPWPGVDQSGIAFQDMPVTAAKGNPWLTAGNQAQNTINLLSEGTVLSGANTRTSSTDGFRFYLWDDLDNDNRHDNGEETEFRLGTLTNADVVAHPNWVGTSVSEVQQNFANWFSYYRSRSAVAKAAFAQVLEPATNMRIGLATIHSNNVVNTAIAEMNQDAVTGNKRNLFDSLYKFTPGGLGTPTRNSVDQAGRYLEGLSNSLFANGDPALPANLGGSCQQNFMLVMTDGFYNGTYTDTIGNADGNNDSPWDGGAYADSETATLADITMHYYERDLRPTYDDNVPTITGIDEANHQHVVTYTLAFGVDGTLADMPADPAMPFAWPDPEPDDPTMNLPQKIDDLRHAAYNGRGEFFNASHPDELVTKLNAALNSIIARTSASAALSFNSSTIKSNTLVFQARYQTQDWSGELLYLPITGQGVVEKPIVNTATELAKLLPDDRSILTLDPSTGNGIPFRWANLNPSQQSLLSSQAVLEYLRGDQSCEVTSEEPCTYSKNYRVRSQVHGDIINSGPVFVGPPNMPYTFDDYPAYVQSQSNRKNMIYVGANEGMLHGFDTTVTANGEAINNVSGKELLAYVPNSVIGQLKEYSAPSYQHKYFVDGTPSVGDVYDGSNWQTMLVGSLRGGGQGIFALNITDPLTFSETNADDIVMWEFSDVQHPDMGYSFSQPVIAKAADGRWVVIFGNGYDNTQADSNASASGNAVLYIVDAITGSLIKWIDTGMGSANDPQGLGRANGLSSANVIDTDGDFIADFVYAGDLFGNIWRFDLTDNVASNWQVSFGGTPLFQAISREGQMQSITTRPLVGTHPSSSGYMVYVGTGRYLSAADNTAVGQATQTLYGIWDKWPKGSVDPFLPFDRTTLLQQEIVEEKPDAWGNDIRITTAHPINWNLHHGWYMDLVNVDGGNTDNQGERQVSNAVFRNGRILFSTLIPNTEVCSFGGSGWLMYLDAGNGGRLDISPFDLNFDGTFSNSDLVSTTDTSGSGAGSGGGGGGGSTGGGTTMATVSGIKSSSGIPSAPALIESSSGLMDYIGINNTSGSTGIGTGAATAAQPTQMPRASSGIDKGRTMWQQIR